MQNQVMPDTGVPLSSYWNKTGRGLLHNTTYPDIKTLSLMVGENTKSSLI